VGPCAVFLKGSEARDSQRDLFMGGESADEQAEILSRLN
jgi:hypothetical protein